MNEDEENVNVGGNANAGGAGAHGGAGDAADRAALAAAVAQAQVAAQQHQARNIMKLETFKSTDPKEWERFRHKFVACARINRWVNLDQKLQLFGAMAGDAFDAVHDIDLQLDVAPPQIAMTANQLLDAYQARFMTPMHGDDSKTAFDIATQNPTEEILTWHGRCRSLYTRAFANVNPQNDPHLINKFIKGIKDFDVKKFVMQGRPETYQQALERAYIEISAKKSLAAEKSSTATKSISTLEEIQESINYIERRMQGSEEKEQPRYNFRQGGAFRGRGFQQGRGNFRDRGAFQGKPRSEGSGDKLSCYFCLQPGHIKPECPLWKKALDLITKRGSSNYSGANRFQARKPFNRANRFSPTKPRRYQAAGINMIAEMTNFMDEMQYPENYQEDIICEMRDYANQTIASEGEEYFKDEEDTDAMGEEDWQDAEN